MMRQYPLTILLHDDVDDNRKDTICCMKELKKILNEKNISIRKLSRITSIPESTLHAMINEQIKQPSFNTIVKISEVLNVPLESFKEKE